MQITGCVLSQFSSSVDWKSWEVCRGVCIPRNCKVGYHIHAAAPAGSVKAMKKGVWVHMTFAYSIIYPNPCTPITISTNILEQLLEIILICQNTKNLDKMKNSVHFVISEN